MLETDISEVLKDYTGPTYIFDLNYLNKHLLKVKETLGDKIKLCYAIKANPFIVNEMDELVDSFEICSFGEFKICEKSNIKADKIFYSGVNKTEPEVSYVMKKGVTKFTAESKLHAEIISKCAISQNKFVEITVRLSNGAQFGMSKDDISYIIEKFKNHPNVKINGIHFFTGTQNMNSSKLNKELDYMQDLIRQFEKNGWDCQLFEYGTGLPYSYFDDKKESLGFEILKDILPKLEKLSKKMQVTLEMGRFLTAGCGNYLTKVVDTKQVEGTNIAIVDGGIHQLVYQGQMMGMKVPIIKHIKRHLGKINEDWMICGSLCTFADVIVRKASFESLRVDDILIFAGCGAYTMTEGITLLLSRNLPQVMFYSKEKRFKIVRKSQSIYQLNTTEEV